MLLARLCAIEGKEWCERARAWADVQSRQYEARSMSCARRAKVALTDDTDDWDVYYERGRKPKESIIKYEAARSEGDYRRKVLLARIIGVTFCINSTWA